MSTDFVPALQAWSEKMGLTFPLISDLPRTTLAVSYTHLTLPTTERV